MSKFFVNARFLTQPISGVQRFAIEISKNLAEHPEITFLAPKNILHEDLAKSLKVKVIGRFKGHLWEQFDLPVFLRNQQSPILLNLSNTAPLFYSKNIVIIHDMAVWDVPQSYSFIFRKFYSFLLPRIARSAVKVFTVSEFSKKRIKEVLQIDTDVVYNSVSEKFVVPSERNKENKILAVSSLDPKKNFENLIKAFQLAKLKDFKLIVLGTKNKVFKSKHLEKLIHADPNIEFTGYVSDEELIKHYQSATVFVFPSFYEGFGIPPLEAMACGCPTIVSDIPSLREICQDASIYVDPFSISDIAQKLTQTCSSRTIQETITQRGITRVKSFSWKTSANLLIQLIVGY